MPFSISQKKGVIKMFSILDLLRSDGSIVINKKLAKEIGLNETVIYSELVSLYKYWEGRGDLTKDGWFFCTYKNLEDNTTIQQKTAQRVTTKLVKLGLIEKKIMGLPAKTYYKITNGIYDFMTGKDNKSRQFVQSDQTNVPDDENTQKPRHDQHGQIVQSRAVKMSNLGWSNCPPNNTRTNNTDLITKEEERDNNNAGARVDNPAFKILDNYLNEKGLSQDTTSKIISELDKQGIDNFSIKNMENQYNHMMDKLVGQEVDNHNGFVTYFVNGLKMRTEQVKVSKQYQQAEQAAAPQTRDTSFYYDWLKEVQAWTN